MKLLFVYPALAVFNVETPVHHPLGGTESAVAYLTVELAARGHDVTLLAYLPPGTPARLKGVRHVPMSAASNPGFFAAEAFEAVVMVSTPADARPIRAVTPKASHYAWLHMMPDQPAMAHVEHAAEFIDCAVFVSDTQRALTRYPGRSCVIGNGIAPSFKNLFGSADEILSSKRNQAVYTSTPFRGLDVLAQVMAAAKVETELEVYSSMKLYQTDDQPYEHIYALVAATPRCRYYAPLGQRRLAQRLKTAAFLTYPCTFPETYCITALEAIAAGLKVIATDSGALRETTLGFADLVPYSPDLPRDVLVEEFARRVEANVLAFKTEPKAWAQERFEQAQAVNKACSWRARADQWETLLNAGAGGR